MSSRDEVFKIPSDACERGRDEMLSRSEDGETSKEKSITTEST
jgi:hypothetical protein